ncbi:hypothetical protein F6R98_05590 [Candidatus Methylospira mobilis]|uniref:Uncharacterized protein n=1 Tax=Candidatus Methylospira mobilis TaxID=1808979 RepID=A0A5Q0BIZ2_9GAMM|nr:hypothetical protein [Candidatus Methylospira mobilis]QFY42171.1 hypothetical protein F6R98_05590 [Candidatus Methylospira mobilis]WNV03185.1 hypothetical protein RP726_11965 [Candidatus Methylospira mobilis]
MTVNKTSDPDDVANMLANMEFDCELGYQEIIEAENAKKAIKRWSLFELLLGGNEKDHAMPPLEDRIDSKES